MKDARAQWVPPGIDLVIALALAAAGLVEVLASAAGGADMALALAATLPLAWRRRLPRATLAAVVLALTTLSIQGESSFTVAQLVGLMLAAYTVAAELNRQSALIGMAALVLAAMANSAAGRSSEPGDYVFPVILLGSPWLAGYGMQSWQRRAEEMRTLADALEAERDTHAELVIAAERGRIARDLHDSLAQSLNAVVVHAEVAEAASGRDVAVLESSLHRIQEIGRASLAETREILGALRGVDGTRQPHLDQLDQLVDHYRSAGLLVTLDQVGEPLALSSSAEATVYRIIQEGLTNVLRHSSGRRAWVCIEHGVQVRVQVRDDGANRPATNRPGFGLLGMRERVALLGGELVAERRNGGFVVEAKLPGRLP